MKTCSRCHQQKDERDFQIRKASSDGLTAACKACISEYDKLRGSEPHRVLARKEYQNSANGREKCNAAKRRFILRNPLKRKAHIIVGNFLRDGKLIRPEKCDCCGCRGRPQAHHCDYSKPTEVMWLCKDCHVEWHKKFKPLYPDEPKSA